VGQGSGSGSGTDLSGFSSLSDCTCYSDGSFNLSGLYNFFASSTEGDPRNIFYITLGAESNSIYLLSNVKNYARSIRCIMDGLLLLLSPNGRDS
jgi:uncharacterized protein (TIGR02145 family)